MTPAGDYLHHLSNGRVQRNDPEVTPPPGRDCDAPPAEVRQWRQRTKIPRHPRTASTVTNSSSIFQPRASSLAAAWLATADVTPTGHRVGRYLVNLAGFAKVTDVQRKVRPGEVFCYPKQATIAAALGVSERQVRRGIASLKSAGLEVRRRPRPFEASIVFPPVDRSQVRSCDQSGVLSQPYPRRPTNGPGKGVTRRRSERRTPDAPSKGQARFMADLLCERKGLKPEDADQFIEGALKRTRYEVSQHIGTLIRLPRNETMRRTWLPPAARPARIETLRAAIAEGDGSIDPYAIADYRQELEALQ